MIISASRRTDIPAFYADWFINRIREGYCTVPNPFNRKQISRVSLHPEDVDVIVFWTRNPKPLFPHLAELDARGFRYYFQYTIMDNPRTIDPKTPPANATVKTLIELADMIGPDKIIWRYDPIIFSSITSPQFHKDTYQRIAAQLNGSSSRSVISIMDEYKKIAGRLAALRQQGVEFLSSSDVGEGVIEDLAKTLVEIAHENGFEIFSCAEEVKLSQFGIKPGKCIDDDFIRKIFKLDVTRKKDPSQRLACGCVASKDIGMYDTCLFGCQYCYATSSFELAKRQNKLHDPSSPSLVGHYDVETSDDPDTGGQMSLWDGLK